MNRIVLETNAHYKTGWSRSLTLFKKKVNKHKNKMMWHNACLLESEVSPALIQQTQFQT